MIKLFESTKEFFWSRRSLPLSWPCGRTVCRDCSNLHAFLYWLSKFSEEKDGLYRSARCRMYDYT